MRIRTIKPEFFRHEGLSELSIPHRMLFAGLWCFADREGRMRDRPRQIKLDVFPFDDVDVDAMLSDLAGHRERFVVRYEVDGERYIAIPKFSAHQRPHMRESASNCPVISEGCEVQALPRSVPAPTLVVPSTDLGECEASPRLPVRGMGSGKGNGKGRGMDLSASQSVEVLPAVAEARQTWLTPFLTAWERANGGSIKPARLAGVVGGLTKSAPAEDVLQAWCGYLAKTSPQYASPERFAERWRAYHPDAVDTLDRGDSIEAHNRRTVRQVLAARKAATR